ncbi:MAG: hypothetical protein H6626_05225 [Pseudobdellovibrionaceae bacterium]|nr:MAG: hypothetical protein H6626_05225 [Pseudobdellovibrionaceae bacterium]
MKNLIILLTLLSLLPGCASLKDSLITGAAVGAASGGLMGNAHSRGHERHKNTNKGLLIGAALGAGIGYLAYKTNKNKKAKEQKQKLLTSSKETIPLLTRPKIKRVWVEDKIQGKRFIRGHWEYVIEEQSTWSQK